MKHKRLSAALSILAATGVVGGLTVAYPAGASSSKADVPRSNATGDQGLVGYSTVRGERVVHGLGGRVDPNPRRSHPGARVVRAATTVPASYSLARYDNGPGDQGGVGSCVAWSIDYTAMNILENEQGIAGHPQAPMYTYAQIVQGNDNGSWPAQNFDILASQGVDTRADYWQGDYDYTTQPDAHEHANAANWKLSGYTRLATGSGAVADIKKAISSGLPVAIVIQVHQSWMNISAADAAAYTYMPGPAASDPDVSGHGVTIIGYNSQGVRIENSWNTYWGDGGYINVPWSFVIQQIQEADAVGKLVPKA